MVDPFAGGGSIPLQALRVGCDALARDLNPVACLILNVLLEDIPRHGPATWTATFSLPRHETKARAASFAQPPQVATGFKPVDRARTGAGNGVAYYVGEGSGVLVAARMGPLWRAQLGQRCQSSGLHGKVSPLQTCRPQKGRR